MRRDPNELAGRRHDVLVIGAGIAGAALARELALRGLAVALIDRDDFGAATSANSLGILHGGLRYLQSLDLTRLRASAREQAVWARIAPHLVRPLACCVPTTCSGRLRRERLAAGLGLYDALTAGQRPPTLPRPRLCTLSELESRIGGLESRTPLTGGAIWYELLCPRPERLVLALVHSAVAAGAVACNYVEATGLVRRAGQVCGAIVRDALADGSFEVRARVVVDATGPWAGRLLDPPPARPLLVAWNLVLDAPHPPDAAVGLPATLWEAGRPSQRLLFSVPTPPGVALGTFYAPAARDAPPTPRTTHVEYALAALRAATIRPARRDARPAWVQIGLQPAMPRRGAGPARRPQVIDHGRTGGPDGLYSLCVEKLTTARRVAEALARRIAAQLGQRRAARGDERPLVGGDVPDLPTYAAGLRSSAPAELHGCLQRWVESYGTLAGRLVALGPQYAQPLSIATDVREAEVVHAVRDELAVTLADVVFRRTGLAGWQPPDPTALERASVIMADVLGWSPRRRAAEVAFVRAEWAARSPLAGCSAGG